MEYLTVTSLAVFVTGMLAGAVVLRLMDIAVEKIQFTFIEEETYPE